MQYGMLKFRLYSAGVDAARKEEIRKTERSIWMKGITDAMA
jgi:hypothetical protein